MAAARRRSGFTLVELLVVVLIIGMTAGVATVSWRRTVPRTKLNSAVRTLASQIWTCRSDAIARNAEFRIEYQLDEERYWIRTPFLPGGGLTPNIAEEGQVVGEKRLAPDGVEIASVTIDGLTFTDGLVYVRFSPLGHASGHTVVLYHPAFDRYYTVEVIALTGLIRFHEGIFEREVPRRDDFR